jgi:hypothetical protein
MIAGSMEQTNLGLLFKFVVVLKLAIEHDTEVRLKSTRSSDDSGG